MRIPDTLFQFTFAAPNYGRGVDLATYFHRIVRTAFFLLTAAGLCLAGQAGAGSMTREEVSDFQQIIAQAKEAVFPSVVFLMPIAERYDAGKKEKTQVSGSGVVISPDGEVVTNWHVVDKAVEIRCLLYNGVPVKAAIIGTDKDTDLALLRLELPDGMKVPFADLGDSSHLQEGEFVIAMGAPWGLSRSVSLGILSCVNRFLSDQGGGYNLWLQTDASINPGNSGGPLVNTEGKIIGINSLAILLGGNMAFAIPSNTVKSVVAALRRDGRVIRAWTGIHLQPLKDFEKNIFYPGDAGALVATVDPESPAYAAGVRVGDVLLAVNGRPVVGMHHENIPAVNQMLAELPVGGEAKFTFKSQDGETRTVAIVPIEKGRVEGDDFDCRRWNMTVKTINEFATPMLHFFRQGGVYVRAVKYPGNANNAGLENGDIILAIDGVPVPDLDACRKIYETVVNDDLRPKKVVFTVLRAGLEQYLVLDYAPRYGQD